MRSWMGEREELLVTTTRKLKSGNETGVLQRHKTLIGFYMLNMFYGEKPRFVLSGVLYGSNISHIAYGTKVSTLNKTETVLEKPWF